MPSPDKPKSRQQRWQDRQRLLKRCAVCGAHVESQTLLCDKHRKIASDRLRARRGSSRRYTTVDQWKTVDWSQPIKTIAEQMGVRPGTARWRKKSLNL